MGVKPWISRLLVLMALTLATACSRAASTESTNAVDTLLRIASFNCWGIPLVAERWRARCSRIPTELEKLNLDVICLQEVWVEGDRTLIANAMAKTHPHAARAKGGLLTLSRWPIVSQHGETFPLHESLSFAERLGAKGFQDLQLLTPAGPLRVINTHLTYAPGENPARTMQLGVLLNYIKRYDGEALVVAGDFNTPTLTWLDATPHVQHQRLLRAGLTDAYVLGRHEGTGRARFMPPPNTRVPWPRKYTGHTGWDPDHVLYRSGKSMAMERVSHSLHFDGIDDALSDHILVLAELRVKRRAR